MNRDHSSAPVDEVEVAEAPPAQPLWKRVLFFDLGFPGHIIEGGLKGLHILILVILGVEVFDLPWASHTVVKPMEGLVLEAGSPWQREGETLKTGARYTPEPAVVTLPLQCAERSCSVHFSMKLLNAHSDAELIFPVGKIQAVLMMNHQGFTGLALGNGGRWSGGEKAEPIKYYIGDENTVRVHVRLFGDAASWKLPSTTTVFRGKVKRRSWPWTGSCRHGRCRAVTGSALRRWREAWRCKRWR